jgi:hypothetical protein
MPLFPKLSLYPAGQRGLDERAAVGCDSAGLRLGGGGVGGGSVVNAVRHTAFDVRDAPVRDAPCAHPDKGLAWCNRH